MYSAPLGGLCPCRPGADFTLARSTIKASGGGGSVLGGGLCLPLARKPPPHHILQGLLPRCAGSCLPRNMQVAFSEHCCVGLSARGSLHLC